MSTREHYYQIAYTRFLISNNHMGINRINQYKNYLDKIHVQFQEIVGEIEFDLFLMLCKLNNVWYLARVETDPDYQVFNEVFGVNVSETDFKRYFGAFSQLE